MRPHYKLCRNYFSKLLIRSSAISLIGKIPRRYTICVHRARGEKDVPRAKLRYPLAISGPADSRLVPIRIGHLKSDSRPVVNTRGTSSRIRQQLHEGRIRGRRATDQRQTGVQDSRVYVAPHSTHSANAQDAELTASYVSLHVPAFRLVSDREDLVPFS
jgi:hypothetical protein